MNTDLTDFTFTFDGPNGDEQIIGPVNVPVPAPKRNWLVALLCWLAAIFVSVSISVVIKNAMTEPPKNPNYQRQVDTLDRLLEQSQKLCDPPGN